MQVIRLAESLHDCKLTLLQRGEMHFFLSFELLAGRLFCLLNVDLERTVRGASLQLNNLFAFFRVLDIMDLLELDQRVLNTLFKCDARCAGAECVVRLL